MRTKRLLSYPKWLLAYPVNFGIAAAIVLAVSLATAGGFAQAQTRSRLLKKPFLFVRGA